MGLWYERFAQVSDEEVLRCLRRARGQPAEGEVGELWDGEWIGPERGDPAAIDPEEGEILAIPFDGSPSGPGVLDAELVLPAGAKGLVMFVHGSGSTRHSPRNRLVARAMQHAGFATLLFDLLTPAEAAEDEETSELRFDIELLTGRVMAATRWMSALPRTRGLRVGYFGASTGAAAALAAAARAARARRGGRVARRSPRPRPSRRRSRRSARRCSSSWGAGTTSSCGSTGPSSRTCATAELAVVPGATHLFEEPGTLDAVARLAARWFERCFASTCRDRAAPDRLTARGGRHA